MSQLDVAVPAQLRRRLKWVTVTVAQGVCPDLEAHEKTVAALGAQAIKRLLESLLEGLTPSAQDSVRPGVVGYGSAIEVLDIGRGTQAIYVVMSGYSLDIEAGHVSMDSPLGRALLGATVGDFVVVKTPSGTARIKVLEVMTLLDILEELEECLGGSPIIAGVARRIS